MIDIFHVKTDHPGFLYQHVAAPSMSEAVEFTRRKFHDNHASNNGGSGYYGEMNVTKAEFYCKAVGADYDTANTEACADLYTVSFEVTSPVDVPNGVYKCMRVIAHDIIDAVSYTEGANKGYVETNIPRAELDCRVLGAKITEARNAS